MPHEPREPFGSYVRRTREEKGLTQQDVEKNGGPSQSTISLIEKSAETDSPKVPTRRQVGQFSRGLGVPLAKVEKAAGLLPGGSRPPMALGATAAALEESGMRPAWLSTGDVVYLSPDDPDPDETLVALDAFLTGWRQGWQARATSRETRKRLRRGAPEGDDAGRGGATPV